jgi:ankyrin repeat protein
MEGQGVDNQNHHGQTALHLAAGNGYEDMVAFLLGKGANATIKSDEGLTPLMEASIEGSVGVARLLLEHMRGKGVNARDRHRKTALFHAAAYGCEDMVAFLLSKGANATIASDEGLTPLMEVSIEGHVGVARLLLEHMGGEGMNARDVQGKTALFHAAGNGYEDMVALLLSKGADATIASNHGLTPLMQVSIEEHVGVARLLLEHMGREGLDTKDIAGMTALHHAASWGYDEVVSLLLAKGSNTTIESNGGLTPLMHASANGHGEVARLLFEHMEGEGIDTQDDRGKTALYHAAFKGHDGMVSFLLAKGADPNITDLDGRTALVCACRASRWRVVLLLARHMGRHALEIRARQGRTPLYLACAGNHWDWARLLILAGADHTTTDYQGHRPPGFDENVLPVSTLTHLLSMILNAF